jgi:hypothetical protein
MFRRQLQKPERFSSYYNLRDACAEGECPLCIVTKKAEAMYLDSLLYENINDPGVHEKLNASLGFCRFHALQLLSFGDACGTAILYSRVLQQTKKAIEKKIENPFGEILFGKGKCPACSVLERHEANYVRELCERLGDPEMRKALSAEKNPGLCVPHLNTVIMNVRNDEDRRWLLSLQREKINRIRNALKEFVRKQDVQYRHEKISQEEDDACRKALNIVVGTIS